MNPEILNIDSNIKPNISAKSEVNDINNMIQDEGHEKIITASAAAKDLIALAGRFQDVKRSLNSYKNIAIEYIFEKIGYEYKGAIQEPNFLHLSAESWIIGLFQELEKEVNGNIPSLSFNSLINLISQIIVKENVFIENMEILIGKFEHLKPFTREDKIFRSILIDLNSTKNEILKDEKILKNKDLSYSDFNEIFGRILKISFNIFLNNINSAEENKKSLALFELFEKVRKSENNNFAQFLKLYAAEKNWKEITDKNLINQLDGFYRFSLCSFEDLIHDVDLFNKNSSSLLYKIISLIPIIKIHEILNNKLDVFKKFFANYSTQNLRLERVKNFLESIITIANKSKNDAIAILNDKKEGLKNWINSSECIKFAKDKAFSIYNKGNEYFINYFKGYYKFAFDKFNFFYNPLKDKTLEIKDKGFSYILGIKDASKEKVLFYKQIILGYFTLNYNRFKEYIFGSEPLLKVISKENDDYFSIEIKKKLLIINPAIVFEILAFVKSLFFRVLLLDYIFSTKTDNRQKIAEGENQNFQQKAESKESN